MSASVAYDISRIAKRALDEMQGLDDTAQRMVRERLVTSVTMLLMKVTLLPDSVKCMAFDTLAKVHGQAMLADLNAMLMGDECQDEKREASSWAQVESLVLGVTAPEARNLVKVVMS